MAKDLIGKGGSIVLNLKLFYSNAVRFQFRAKVEILYKFSRFFYKYSPVFFSRVSNWDRQTFASLRIRNPIYSTRKSAQEESLVGLVSKALNHDRQRSRVGVCPCETRTFDEVAQDRKSVV